MVIFTSVEVWFEELGGKAAVYRRLEITVLQSSA